MLRLKVQICVEMPQPRRVDPCAVVRALDCVGSGVTFNCGVVKVHRSSPRQDKRTSAESEEKRAKQSDKGMEWACGRLERCVVVIE